MDENKRLGKGLGAIFGDDLSNVIEEIQQGTIDAGKRIEIPLKEIRSNPYQPRKIFDEAKLTELAQSISEHGVFTPVLVRAAVKGYELIAGERRVRAAKIAGLDAIPAIVMEFTDDQMMEIGLLENIQREDLNVIEEANAYQQIMERLKYTQEQLANRIGKSREHVANILRLKKLPPQIQEMVLASQLTMGHVRPLVTIIDEDEAVNLAYRIIAEGLSVRDVEKLVKMGEVVKTKKSKVVDHDLDNVRYLLERKLQTNVKVDKKKIEIKYEGVDDLNRILEILNIIEED